MAELLRSEHIQQLFSSDSAVKAAVSTAIPFKSDSDFNYFFCFQLVERAIRTLKRRIYKYFTMTKKEKWIGILPHITKAINETVHRTTGLKPNAVNKENQVFFFL